MNIAFILVTHKWSRLCDRLVARLLEFPSAKLFIHHDESQSSFPEWHRANPKITRILPYRPTEWAGASIVYAEVDALTLAFRDSFNADMYVLLSGACYPIKRVDQIIDRLSHTPDDGGYLDLNLAGGKEGLPSWWWKKIFTRPLLKVPFISRHGRFYLREIRVQRGETPFSKALPLCFGSQWFMLTRTAVATLLERATDCNAMLEFLSRIAQDEKKHMAADECVIQSILNSTDLQFSSNTLRYIDWNDSRDWHPNTLTMAHWPDIASTDALFARKFDPVASGELLDKIDRELLHRQPART